MFYMESDSGGYVNFNMLHRPLKTAKCFFKLDIELFYADYNNHFLQAKVICTVSSQILAF